MMLRVILVSLFAVFASHASAHRGGGTRPVVGRGGLNRNGFQQRPLRGHAFGNNRGSVWLPYGFDYGYDGYVRDYDASVPYGYQSQPIIPAQPIMLLQQQPPPPPREGHPVIIEVSLRTPEPSAPYEGQPQTFEIVLKNGSTRAAVAVLAGTSDGLLHYVDSEQRNLRISMNEVDREATLKLNRERKLNLWLPPTQGATEATPNR